MPGLDRTGPEGQGSQTGRRLGKCNPENQIEQANKKENDEQNFGGGRGRGPWGGGTEEERRAHDRKGVRGRGRGRRFRGGNNQ